MDSAHLSIAGPKGRNQDSFLPLSVNGEFTLAGVADGVGGNADGKFASETAIGAVDKFFRATPSSPLREAVVLAQHAIAEAVVASPLSKSMATTLTVVRIHEEIAEIAHVGDTRIYHLRNGGLLTRTEDQTEVAELVRQKVFTREEARRYPRRNVLISSLSAEREFDLFETSFSVETGDGIILCSDGFYNAFRKVELVEAFGKSDTAQAFVDEMASLSSDKEIRDDATLVFIRV